MAVCEICKRFRNPVDVLCPACRETITRLTLVWQNKPVNPAGAQVPQTEVQKTQADTVAAMASDRKPKPKTRRFRAFSIFENGENLIWG
jgi:uncharacterized Zn finger protein (UPF0148 family)